MNPADLHAHLKTAINSFCHRESHAAFRALLESGGIEGFIAGLLFMELSATGWEVSREYPLPNGNRADLTVRVEEGFDLHIELKQLNLKDPWTMASQNIIDSLTKHPTSSGLGVIYLIDDRNSKTTPRFLPHNGNNRKAKHDPPYVLANLRKYFSSVYPATVQAAALRSFSDFGATCVYAFVVAGPLVPAKR